MRRSKPEVGSGLNVYLEGIAELAVLGLPGSRRDEKFTHFKRSNRGLSASSFHLAVDQCLPPS